MNIKTKQTIFAFSAGALIGIISLFTNGTLVNIEITTTKIPLVQIFILYLANTISVPLFVAFLNIMPDSANKLKHVFNAKYFYMISIFILGIAISTAPHLFISNNNLASIIFVFCLGSGLLIGSLITNKLFGGLS